MAQRFHSADLQWQLLRNSHSFLVKRNGATFSSEPLNLTNQHSFKFSGLVNSKAVGLNLTADRKNVELSIASGKKSSRPSSAVSKQLVRKTSYRGKSTGVRTIKTNVAASFVRPDLTNYAIHRFHVLRKATQGVGAKKAARRAARK